MKSLIYLILAIGFFFMTGCLNVFQPLITVDQNVRDKRIEGDWKMGNTQINITEYSKSPLISQKLQDIGHQGKRSEKENQDSIKLYHNSYIFSFADAKYRYYFHLQMTVKNKTQFVQFYPLVFTNTTASDFSFNEGSIPESRFNAFGAEGIMSTFSFGRLKFIDNNQLEIQFIDGEKIKGLILTGNMKTRYAFDNLYDNSLITASTDELEKLVNKYGNNDELYSRINSYKFVKMQ